MTFEEQLKYDLFQAYYDARRHKRNTCNQLRFEIEYEHNLLVMWERILNRTYEIRKSIAFIVNEPIKREIFAADFSDRIVHHLIFNYINPLLDTQFIGDSYSCRKNKGTHYGVARVAEFMKECSKNYTQDCYVMKLDIRGYFMSINKHLLWKKLQKMLPSVHCFTNRSNGFDFNLVWWLLDKVIWNDPTQSCVVKGKRSDWNGLPASKSLFYTKPDCGLPIGNLTSQLFSNAYLHDFDCFVKEQLGIMYYGRYVDDFVLIHRNKTFLLEALKKIKCYLAKESDVLLHPNKIYLQHYVKGFSFLGVYVKPHRCYIAKRTKKKFFEMLWNAGQDKENIWSREKLIKVRASLNSYLGIMKHYNTYNLLKKVLLKKTFQVFFKYGYLVNMGIYKLKKIRKEMIEKRTEKIKNYNL